MAPRRENMGIILLLLASVAVTCFAQSASKGLVSEAVLGRSAKIYCNVTSPKPVMVTLWYKDAQKKPMFSYDARSDKPREWSDSMHLGDRAKYEALEKPPYLSVSNINETDEGVYRCRVDYRGWPTQSSMTRLSVIVPPGEPTILRDDGVVVSNGIIGPYNEGSTVKFSCQVKGGTPPPQVKWWRGGELQDNNVEVKTAGINRNTFTIAKLTREHLNTTFVCQVKNHEKVSAVSKAVRVDVNLPPLEVKILGNRPPVIAHHNTTARCLSVGDRPPANISWTLGGKPLPNNTYETKSSQRGTVGTLTFIPTEADAKKLLVCRAEVPNLNHTPVEDTWELDVHSVPTVQSIDIEARDPNDIIEGDNVTLWCRVKAHPKVDKITWFHKGIQVHHNLSEGIKVGRQKLMFINVEREHGGLYTCMGTNAVGDGESPLHVLDVKYSPVCSFSGSKKVGLAVNDSVLLTCEVEAKPDEVKFTWALRTAKEMLNIPTDWYNVQERNSVLNYRVGGIYSYGEILCYATNSVGEQARPCSYTLVAAGKPEPTKSCTVTNHTADTLYVECIPGYDGGLEQEFVLGVYDSEDKLLLRNETMKGAPSFIVEDLHPETSYLLRVYAQNSKGKSTERMLHGSTLPSAQPGTAIPATHIFPITPILGVLIGVVGALVLVAVVVVVVMKLRGDASGAKGKPEGGLKGPHSPLHPSKDGDDCPDVILCRTDPTYEDVDGIPQKLKHANIYETVPYDSKDKNSKNNESADKDEVEYAELTFSNGKSKAKKNKKSGANGAVRCSSESTIYATIDHSRTAAQAKQGMQKLQQTQQNPKKGKDLESLTQVEIDSIPLMDAALESSV